MSELTTAARVFSIELPVLDCMINDTRTWTNLRKLLADQAADQINELLSNAYAENNDGR